MDNFAKSAGLSAIFLRKNKEQPVSGAAPFAVTYSIILSSSPLSIVDGISRTIRSLGYPSRTLLKQWLVESHSEDFSDCVNRVSLINFTTEQKEQAALDLCTREGNAKSVADKYGVSQCSLYKWKHQFIPKGSIAKMPKIIKNNTKASMADMVKTQLYSFEKLPKAPSVRICRQSLWN